MRRKAFTLIELLVVIAIIAILAAILFPVFARAWEKAQTDDCLCAARRQGTAVSMYATDYDGRDIDGLVVAGAVATNLSAGVGLLGLAEYGGWQDLDSITPPGPPPHWYLLAEQTQQMCSCDGQTGSYSYQGSGPAGWRTEDSSCTGSAPCPVSYWGVQSYSATYQVPAGKCAAGCAFYLHDDGTPVPICVRGHCSEVVANYQTTPVAVPGALTDCPE